MPPQTNKTNNRAIHLNKIPEPLSQLQLLIALTHAIIANHILTRSSTIIRDLLALELPVQAREHVAEQEAADDRGAEHGEGDGVAAAEAVGRQAPDVGAGDVADLAEGVDHGDCDGAFGWGPGEGGGDPGVEDYEAVCWGRNVSVGFFLELFSRTGRIGWLREVVLTQRMSRLAGTRRRSGLRRFRWTC